MSLIRKELETYQKKKRCIVDNRFRLRKKNETLGSAVWIRYVESGSARLKPVLRFSVAVL